MVRHLPSGPWTRLATVTWVCSCGSPLRESQWSNAAATTPPVRTRRTPCAPVRVNTASVLDQPRVCGIAARCASYSCTCSAVVGDRPQRRHRLRHGERQVEPGDRLPRLGVLLLRRIRSIAVALAPPRAWSPGASRSAARSAPPGSGTSPVACPSGAPLNGLRPSSNSARSCSSVTSVPATFRVRRGRPTRSPARCPAGSPRPRSTGSAASPPPVPRPSPAATWRDQVVDRRHPRQTHHHVTRCCAGG